MKQLLFIDNDQERDVQESETCHIHHQLKRHFDLNYDDMTIVRSFWHKCRDEGDEAQSKMMFEDPNIAIVTYSMYTSSHYGSLHSFAYFLNIAGRWRIKDKVYINLSMEEYMMKALEYAIENEKNKLNILRAVAKNHLISYDYESKTLTKVVVDLTHDYKCFKTVPITLEEFNKLIDKEG